MRSPANARKPLRTDGRTDRRTDGRTDGHAVKRLRLAGWTNGPMYRSKEGISGFGRTDGRTTRKHNASGAGIKRDIWKCCPQCAVFDTRENRNMFTCLIMSHQAIIWYLFDPSCPGYSVCWTGRGTALSHKSLRWRHNDQDGVSNHQPHGCLLNRLFRRRSNKTSKLRVTGLCVGNSPGPVNSPHKGPVTRKMFPFDDVIMWVPQP